MRNTSSSPNQAPARRRLPWIAAALAALVLALAALMLVALQTEWGARMLWQTASRMTQGQLSGEFAGGTLSSGIRLRNVVYRDDSKLVSIDRLESGWRLVRSPLTLIVQFLHLGTVDITLFPAPPAPRTLPRQLTLPLAIEVQNATVSQLAIHQDGQTMRSSDIRLQARSDRVRHAITLVQALTPQGTATAALRLNGRPPFDVAGTAGLSGKYDETPYRLDARLSGTLRALRIQLDVKANNLDGQATIEATPFSAIPFRRARVSIRGLNPQAFNAEWPRADLNIHALLAPVEKRAGDLTPQAVAGSVSMTNAQSGAIDRGLLPLVSASADLVLDARRQQVSRITITLPGKATVTGGGDLRDGQGKLALQVSRLDLHALYTTLRPSQLSGPLAVRFAGDTQHVELTLAGPALAVAAQAALDPQRIVLHSALVRAGAAQLALSGTLARDAQAAYSVTGSLRDVNPFQFLTPLPRIRNRNARINADVDVHGFLNPSLSAHIQFDVRDSMYANLPMTGGGTVQIEGRQLLPSAAQLSIAGNTLRLDGSFGAPGNRAPGNRAPGSRLVFAIDAPALDRLGFGWSGLLRLNGEIGGTLERPLVDVRYQAENLAFGAYRLDSLSGAAHTTGVPGATPNARVKLDLNARGVRGGDLRLDSLDAGIGGTYADHAIRITATGSVRGEALDLTLAAQGRLQEETQGLAWDGVLRTLENRGVPRVSLASPLPLGVGPGRLTLGAGRLTIAQAAIDLKSLRYEPGLISSEGAVSALDAGRLLAWWRRFTGASQPFSTDLLLDGSWNVMLADRADGFINITRRRGDLRLAGDIALGLNTLSLRAVLQADRVMLDVQAGAQRIGTLRGQGQIGLQRADGRIALTPQAPVSARITAAMPRLRTLASLTGPRIALDGSLGMDLAVAGTLGEPILSGTVAADALALTLFDQGVRLRDGVARLRLADNIVELQRLEFFGGEGTLRVSGRVPLDRSARGLRATIVADKLQLLTSPSAQMTVSGRAEATDASGQMLVTGKFIADRALFSRPEQAAPALDDDVVVIRGGKPSTGAARGKAGLPGPFTPAINIEFGLGDNFHFEGSGADLRLAGRLTLRSEPGAPPQAFGTVQVVEGSYEAFGTELVIEHGVINFQGSLRNPNVNILAMRREQDVAAGVQLTGNVRQPRVQLVSEPDLPADDKLSWLVFGRSSGATPGQAENLAEGAALGLLNMLGTGPIAKTLGLDELSIGETEMGLAGTQVVNLGKEISDRLYIGYEQGLTGATSVLKLTYELTRNWSVILRGGTVTGLDVFYSRRFDGK
ncbi:MAG: translocation/assembly module TamB domain-containing protein [Pseudomonadota bacterium]